METRLFTPSGASGGGGGSQGALATSESTAAKNIADVNSLQRANSARTLRMGRRARRDTGALRVEWTNGRLLRTEATRWRSGARALRFRKHAGSTGISRVCRGTAPAARAVRSPKTWLRSEQAKPGCSWPPGSHGEPMSTDALTVLSSVPRCSNERPCQALFGLYNMRHRSRPPSPTGGQG